MAEEYVGAVQGSAPLGVAERADRLLSARRKQLAEEDRRRVVLHYVETNAWRVRHLLAGDECDLAAVDQGDRQCFSCVSVGCPSSAEVRRLPGGAERRSEIRPGDILVAASGQLSSSHNIPSGRPGLPRTPGSTWVEPHSRLSTTNSLTPSRNIASVTNY